jgi:hypothetical protein
MAERAAAAWGNTDDDSDAANDLRRSKALYGGAYEERDIDAVAQMAHMIGWLQGAKAARDEIARLGKMETGRKNWAARRKEQADEALNAYKSLVADNALMKKSTAASRAAAQAGISKRTLYRRRAKSE